MFMLSGLTLIIHGLVMVAGFIKRAAVSVIRPLFDSDESYSAWGKAVTQPFRNHVFQRIVSSVIVTVIAVLVIGAAIASIKMCLSVRSNYRIAAHIIQNLKYKNTTTIIHAGPQVLSP